MPDQEHNDQHQRPGQALSDPPGSKSLGQSRYESFLRRNPFDPYGKPKPKWSQLSAKEQRSWESPKDAWAIFPN